MQLPYRKPGKYTNLPNDPIMTEEMHSELKKELERLLKARPKAAQEVARLAELGDFSENVEYQLAKGRLRGINNRILKLERQILDAQIVTSNSGHTVEIGSTVTVQVDDDVRSYRILGSTETDPTKGIISYTSPIGAALLGKSIGDQTSIHIKDRSVVYTILSIS